LSYDVAVDLYRLGGLSTVRTEYFQPAADDDDTRPTTTTTQPTTTTTRPTTTTTVASGATCAQWTADDSNQLTVHPADDNDDGTRRAPPVCHTMILKFLRRQFIVTLTCLEDQNHPIGDVILRDNDLEVTLTGYSRNGRNRRAHSPSLEPEP